MLRVVINELIQLFIVSANVSEPLQEVVKTFRADTCQSCIRINIECASCLKFRNTPIKELNNPAKKLIKLEIGSRENYSNAVTIFNRKKNLGLYQDKVKIRMKKFITSFQELL